jgi:hypothetical protein
MSDSAILIPNLNTGCICFFTYNVWDMQQPGYRGRRSLNHGVRLLFQTTSWLSVQGCLHNPGVGRTRSCLSFKWIFLNAQSLLVIHRFSVAVCHCTCSVLLVDSSTSKIASIDCIAQNFSFHWHYSPVMT